jgi:5'-deoxynucleotidase YfbR-like HD superfamily hydrolase
MGLSDPENRIISVADAIVNRLELYEGNLFHYFRVAAAAPNVHHSYHNLGHTLHVARVCYEGLEFYNNTNKKVDAAGARNLLIAALFHDYDHTGMSGPDSANIERAISGLNKHILDRDRPAFTEISGIIRATQFPYSALPENSSLAHRLIRDADLTQGLDYSWIGSIAEGLGAEQGKSVPEMFPEIIKFLSNLHFETEFGRQAYGPKIAERITEASQLLEVLQNTQAYF